jgi:nucleotide-binding universal stress UspA family protein
MIRRILLAVDGEGEVRAETLAAELAGSLAAEVTVLHVREWLLGPAGPFDEGKEPTADLVERVAGRLRARGVPVRVQVRSAYFAHTPQQIVEAAQEQDVDLIVLGTHRGSGVAGSAFGDVTGKVIRRARVPVLVAV